MEAGLMLGRGIMEQFGLELNFYRGVYLDRFV